MPRTIDTPMQPPATRKDITQQWVDSFRIDFSFGQPMSPGQPAVPEDPGPPVVPAQPAVPAAPIAGQGIEIDLAKTALEYDIHQGDEDGVRNPRSYRQAVFHADWPVEVVEAIRTIQQFIETDAEARGYLAAGTSTDNV